MVRLLVLLFALLPFSAGAASIGGIVPQLTIAVSGQNTQALTIPITDMLSTGAHGVFSIYMGVGTATGGNFYPFFRNGSIYRVGDQTGSYGTVKAYCFNGSAAEIGGGVGYQFASGTATQPANGSASITGGVFQGGATLSYVMWIATLPPGAPITGAYVFGASTYPVVQTASAVSYYIHMDCIEQ